MDVRSLYIIRHDTGVCLYHHDFVESVFDPHLLSSFIVAMTSFFDEVTESVTSKARAFEGTDYKVIVEFGEWTVGALSVTQDSEGQRQKLKRVIEQFETQFSVLKWVDIDLAIYTRFERPVIEEFLRNEVNPDSVVHVKSHWEFYTKNRACQEFLKFCILKSTIKIP